MQANKYLLLNQLIKCWKSCDMSVTYKTSETFLKEMSCRVKTEGQERGRRRQSVKCDQRWICTFPGWWCISAWRSVRVPGRSGAPGASEASASSTGLTAWCYRPVTSAGTNECFEQENGSSAGEQRGYRGWEEIFGRTTLNVQGVRLEAHYRGIRLKIQQTGKLR